MPVTMWEVRAAPEQVESLRDWVLARVDATAQVYRSVGGEVRLVVIDPTGQAAEQLVDVPAELVARPAHSWNFESARNV
jgi:hypothetical protein